MIFSIDITASKYSRAWIVSRKPGAIQTSYFNVLGLHLISVFPIQLLFEFYEDPGWYVPPGNHFFGLHDGIDPVMFKSGN